MSDEAADDDLAEALAEFREANDDGRRLPHSTPGSGRAGTGRPRKETTR